MGVAGILVQRLAVRFASASVWRASVYHAQGRKDCNSTIQMTITGQNGRHGHPFPTTVKAGKNRAEAARARCDGIWAGNSSLVGVRVEGLDVVILLAG